MCHELHLKHGQQLLPKDCTFRNDTTIAFSGIVIIGILNVVERRSNESLYLPQLQVQMCMKVERPLKAVLSLGSVQCPFKWC